MAETVSCHEEIVWMMQENQIAEITTGDLVISLGIEPRTHALKGRYWLLRIEKHAVA